MKGYELVNALREDAQECRSEERQQLLIDAANEIEKLIEELKEATPWHNRT